MSDDKIPTRVESRYVYEDKPNLATIMTGGLLFAIIMYYVTGFFLERYGLENEIVQLIFGALVIFFSFKLGTTAAVTIKIDTSTGYIEAENKEFQYTGYAHEPIMFLVLEKTSETNGRVYTDYKLALKADEETTFEIPLDRNKAAEAIKVVQKAKDAVPIRK